MIVKSSFGLKRNGHNPLSLEMGVGMRTWYTLAFQSSKTYSCIYFLLCLRLMLDAPMDADVRVVAIHSAERQVRTIYATLGPSVKYIVLCCHLINLLNH